MKIMVCVRAVPLPESSFRINPAGDFYDELHLSRRCDARVIGRLSTCALRTGPLLRSLLAPALTAD